MTTQDSAEVFVLVQQALKDIFQLESVVAHSGERIRPGCLVWLEPIRTGHPGVSLPGARGDDPPGTRVDVGQAGVNRMIGMERPAFSG